MSGGDWLLAHTQIHLAIRGEQSVVVTFDSTLQRWNIRFGIAVFQGDHCATCSKLLL